MRGKIMDPKEIAERFVRSLSSSLHAFIFDSSLVDPGIVSRIVAVSGTDQYLKRFVKDNVVVYTLDVSKLEKRCRMETCRNVPRERYRICLSECLKKQTDDMARVVAQSIMDAVDLLG
ncbi:MAG: hypothetical protein F7C36_01215 [Desulfurococcales archaeon]|nr:hypothetical protein [Desulfurococcales archaeon]